MLEPFYGHAFTGRSLVSTGCRYKLLSTVAHEGEKLDGPYRVYVHRSAENVWYEAQDLTIRESHPDVVKITEAYLQVYEQQQPAR